MTTTPDGLITAAIRLPATHHYRLRALYALVIARELEQLATAGPHLTPQLCLDRAAYLRNGIRREDDHLANTNRGDDELTQLRQAVRDRDDDLARKRELIAELAPDPDGTGRRWNGMAWSAGFCNRPLGHGGQHYLRGPDVTLNAANMCGEPTDAVVEEVAP